MDKPSVGRLISIIRNSLRIVANPKQRRHVFRWIASLEEDYLLKQRQPWFVFDAIDYLDGLSLKGKRVFEYGSGGSTLYWLDKMATCISIEHDSAWHDRFKTFISKYPGIEYRLVPPDISSEYDSNAHPADPDAYKSSLEQFASSNFRDYAGQIDTFPDRFFDVVLIDGRARPSCIKHGARKVCANGLLILDNSDREYYLERTGPFLEGFQRKEFSGIGPTSEACWKTDIFIRQE